MSQWKGKLAGLVAAGLLAVLPLAATPALAEPPTVPEDIYQWVQSTARQNYYFNKQQMCYEIRADGTVDEHVLIVPTLRTYDDVQIQDVISKRRWKLEDLTGYDALAGAAEYLKIDLAAQTVTITEHDDLDGDWGVIREEKEPEIVQLAELSAAARTDAWAVAARWRGWDGRLGGRCAMARLGRTLRAAMRRRQRVPGN